jgi:hypothetical protein
VAAMKQVVADAQHAYATAGLSGVNRFWADQITNPRMDFDVLLKMAFFRATLYGQQAGSMKRSTASIKPSRSATRHSFTWRSHRIGTACATIRDSTIA